MPCLNCGSNGRENCFCEECFKDESKNPKDILPKYMQASTAYHMLGDLSRKKDVCLVTRENEKYYIGHWLDYVTNNRFVSLLFPKSECQEIKISKNRIIVRTLNSTYLFGEEDSAPNSFASSCPFGELEGMRRSLPQLGQTGFLFDTRQME